MEKKKSKNKMKRKKNTKIPKKSFSDISQFFGGVSKISLFDNLAKTAHTQKTL